MLHRRPTFRSESTYRSELYDQLNGHVAGHKMQQCYTGGQHTGKNCMRNRRVIEQVTRYNNVTQEVNIQVRVLSE
jgi:hypothetical protein